MFESIKNYFIKRKIEQLIAEGKKAAHDFVGLDRAKTIGLIINMSQSNAEDIKDIHKFIDNYRQKGVKVVIFEWNPLKKTNPAFATSAHSVFINPDKTNWYGYPNAQAESQIRQYDIDILINFDSMDDVVAHLISGIARAKTLAGMYHEAFAPFYELMVNFKELRFKKMSPNYEHFLKMIDKG